jgi:isochorismate synthase
MESTKPEVQTTGHRAAARALLKEYRATSPLFLASARHTLLARSVLSRVQVTAGPGQFQALPELVKKAFKEHRGHRSRSLLAVGALPFDEHEPAVLTVPSSTAWAGPLELRGESALPLQMSVQHSRQVPSAEHYMSAVERAVTRIGGGGLSKVVLARSLELCATADVDPRLLLQRLAAKNPAAYTFSVNLPPHPDEETADAQRTLIGASPELLVARSGLDVVSNPLAGSAPRSPDPREDARRAEELLQSSKNREEHAFVVERVAAVLRPFCSMLHVPHRPALLRTDSMWHLSTAIHGRLKDPSTCALTLATALHPTPAVCGTPRADAAQAIRELEGFERGYYAGLLGWCSDEGDGEWIVTIRCAELKGRDMRLYAGAGIVAQSTPAEELQETAAKFKTLLRALDAEVLGD